MVYVPTTSLRSYAGLDPRPPLPQLQEWATSDRCFILVKWLPKVGLALAHFR